MRQARAGLRPWSLSWSLRKQMVHLTGCPVQRPRAAGQGATILPLLPNPQMEPQVMDTEVEPNGCFRPSTSSLPLFPKAHPTRA